MSKLSDYTPEQVEAVVEHFFPEEHYPRHMLTLTDDDKLALMKTFGGSMVIIRLSARSIGVEVGESFHLPELKKRLARYWKS